MKSFIKRSLVVILAGLTVFLAAARQHPCVAAEDATTLTLAEVNGDTIDEKALQRRLEAVHWQVRSGGQPGAIAIGEVVQDMIDDRLMLQEARRLELDKAPDFVKRLKSFVVTQSVLRLRKEEVLDKISVGEDQVLAYFDQHYEKKGRGGPKTLERVKARIEKKLKKEQEKTLSTAFFVRLRQKADIWVDKALIEQVDLEKDTLEQDLAVARVDGEPISLADLVHDTKQAVQKEKRRINGKSQSKIGEEKRKALKSKMMDRLITYKLIEQEALRRNYMKEPAFAGMVNRRKAALLVDAFKRKLVYPLAIPTQKELTQYYSEHIDEFKQGYEVWIREMRFQTRQEAEKILRELKQGASFEFLEAQASGETLPQKDRVWISVDRFPPAIKDAIKGLKVGQVSDVIAQGRKFKIIKLKGKRGGKPVAFASAETELNKVVGRKKFKKVLSEYLRRLRDASTIKVYEKNLEAIEDRYMNAVNSEQ